jgi:hypothetical protein
LEVSGRFVFVENCEVGKIENISGEGRSDKEGFHDSGWGKVGFRKRR